jgi:beta-barrel assembly-enhancing protease
MKLMIKFALIIVVFIAVWFALAQVNWVEIFHIRQFSEKKQKQVGNLIIRTIRMDKKEVEDDSVRHFVDIIKDRLCSGNGIETAKIHIYVFNDDEVNAYALPGNNIIVNTALIKECDDAEMLTGVLAHEIAHIQMDHVTKKLVKEVGLSTLLLLAAGNHSTLSGKVLRAITSSGFDRKQERQADDKGLEYLHKAGIDPKSLSLLFKKLADKGPDLPGAFDWISTHPGSEERAEMIMKKRKNISYQPVMTADDWQMMKNACGK